MHFDREYFERATLRDGTDAVVRLLRPDDKELLRRGFEHLSDESRYRRFFGHKSALSDDELRYLTEIDQRRHVALGAERPGANGVPEGLGVARYVCLDPAGTIAEPAIAVVDDAQGLGLGTLLFQRLIAAARERGVQRFRCEVLGSNRPMQEFLTWVAPHAKARVESGVATVEFPLPAIGAEQPRAEAPRESALYRLFKLAAEGTAEVLRTIGLRREERKDLEG